jgi:NAD+ synthase (glutamine-hydrolysing)
LRLALAQIDTVVGDLDGNARRIRARMEDAERASADLVLFPELALTGYPPEDLLLRPGFVRAAERALAEIAQASGRTVSLVGGPTLDGGLRNSCFVLSGGQRRGVYHKRLLPNYGVFDEQRYFTAGSENVLLRFGELLVGLTVCEDLWWPGPPAAELADAGAQLIVNISASPFHVGKGSEREEIARARATESGCVVALCNAVGGQDELVFDGNSVVCDAAGRVIARAPSFEEALLVVDLDLDPPELRARDGGHAEIVFGAPALQREHLRPAPAPELDELEQMRRALELGLHDYVHKNGFAEVVVGISGGVDSALTAALCVSALGAGRVHGVSMPSRYSSEVTRSDAAALAASLGIDFREIPIEPTVAAFGEAVAPSFAGRAPDLTEENLQARVRGTLLMALSNKFGWLVIATGNKSELSVGYSTLYGDLAGGFALLKDVYKTDVFRLARRLNAQAGRPLIPESIIERAPSAELRADQRDEDTLPPYAELDRVLKAYVEDDQTREELSGDGFDPALVERAVALIDRAEYKRRQAPPGVKIHPKAFGRDRRTPITNRWPG